MANVHSTLAGDPAGDLHYAVLEAAESLEAICQVRPQGLEQPGHGLFLAIGSIAKALIAAAHRYDDATLDETRPDPNEA